MSVDLLIIVLYLVVMLAAGYWGYRRSRNNDDYLVAGRRLGPMFYMGTLAAVVLGGASTVGGVSLGYQYGISGMWLVFWLGVGIIALSVLFSGVLTRLKVYSLPEMLERRYGTAASRAISGVVMVGYDLMVAVTSILAIGTVVNVMIGVPQIPAILIGGAVVVIYSVLGGMWSISLTDILQFGIMTVGIFLILLPVALHSAGGWSGLQNSLPESFFDPVAIGGDTIFTYFLIYFFGIIIGQDIWQRVFTARSPKVARFAGLGAGLYCMAYAVVGAIIGMTAATLYPNLEIADNAFAVVAEGVLPIGLSGLVLAAALAAVMSTASATLLASATILANDVWGRLVQGKERVETMKESRIWVLAAGVVVILISLVVRDVVGALTVAYNLLVGGLLVPVIGALVWRRATPHGAFAAMILGSVTVILFMFVAGLMANEPIYYGLAISAVSFIAVSLLGPKSDEDTLLEQSRHRV
ncbi:sodium:solute symporter [Nesterenkonia sphaerica]|uniref:Sodium:solute symporter n=1 Tax=Nesterenkonia sphaerica TaxID=1804988 RepID=A0A5R9ACY7_9MICC|nr:sodium:solute symporter [Nesterenkonia sphaerica]TLP75727.1 sodium:solute symporter [Nesterenkonia sphaerica]